MIRCLTDSTPRIDVAGRATKRHTYQRIGSLTDYLLVAQAETRIEHYRRNADGSWTYRAAGPGEHVVLTGGGELAIGAILASVECIGTARPSSVFVVSILRRRPPRTS